MDHHKRIKSVLASVLVTLALALPMLAVGVTPPPPTLSFEGASLQVLGKDPDGKPNAQMKFTIYVQDVERCDGATFMLKYNSTYFTPSVDATNAAIVTASGSYEDRDDFFQYNTKLYTPISTAGNPNPLPENPFKQETTTDLTRKDYCQVNSAPNVATLTMKLLTKETNEKPNATSILQPMILGEGGEIRNVFNSTATGSGKVALGTISFKVKAEYLPQIIARFQGHNLGTPEITVSGSARDFLLKEISPVAQSSSWTIGYYTTGGVHLNHSAEANPPVGITKGQLWYRYAFTKTMLSASVTQPQVTLNAYEAYRSGDRGDLARTMQVYSPMATGYYSDGSSENFVIPWGDETKGYGATKGGVAVTDANYFATGGTYQLHQNQTLSYSANDGKPDQTFSVALQAELIVTPITLQGVTAEQLTKTYALNADLLSSVSTGASLRLPQQARLLTDVTPGGVSLTVPIPGWRPIKAGSTWPKADMTVLIEDHSPATDPNAPTCIHWPTTADTGNLPAVAERRKGSYTFEMSKTYGGAAGSTFAQADIQAVYPWLTVPNATYALPQAVRKIVAEEDYISTERYKVSYGSTVTDSHGNPQLTLDVKRFPTSSTIQEDMLPGTRFRCFLPDGTELGTGLSLTGGVGGAVNVPNWFADSATNFSSCTKTPEVTSQKTGFRIATTPGVTTGAAAGMSSAEREELRHRINLGGWFFVSINEDPARYEWTDRIPVYVPPRENLYREDRVYNFIKGNAGLFLSPGGVRSSVTLPRGSFAEVNATGEPLYLAADGTETTSPTAAAGTPNPRKTVPYGIKTTYDGATGSEPGLLHSFSVASWTEGTTTDVRQYGPNDFLDSASYPGYGTVLNRAIPKKPAADGKTNVTVRRPLAAVPAQTESISLTYAGTSGVTIGGDGNVTLATYDTRTVGYTTRQEYTFIITNTGTTTIYGLGVDTVTGGGHFVITAKPQASFLAPGQKTTFTMTYQENLKTAPTPYTDKLYILSTSKPLATREGALLNFDATFLVTNEELHSLVVETVPASGKMGTARVIIGERMEGGKSVMDYTAGSSRFKKSDKVYLAVELVDEYTVKSVSCIDETAAISTVHLYGAESGETATLKKGTRIYCFTMPDYNATATIIFEELVESKLRLSNLQAFSAATTASLAPNQTGTDLRPGCEKNLWQKSFSPAEEAAATAWETANGKAADYFLKTGIAAVKGFLSTQAQYLVVVPSTDGYSQVEATLRTVTNFLGEPGEVNIQPNVTMTLFTRDQLKEKQPSGTQIYQGVGNTKTPTHHVSDTFPWGDKVQELYVRVDIDLKASGTVTNLRSYYLELHRAPAQVTATLHYGNSPYGMIMNDAVIGTPGTPAEIALAKTAAKAAFRDNRYSFAGLDAKYVPAAVTAKGLTNTHYWTEAWSAKGALYEPESNAGAVYDPVSKTYSYPLGVYDEGKNLDLNDLTYFAVLTRGLHEPGILSAKDSSGRAIQVENITCTVEVKLLDTAGLTQTARFADSADPLRTAEISLGKNNIDVAPGWEKSYQIRPGVYALTYHMMDYDGTTVLTTTRPMVVVAPLGDVDSNGTVTKTDAASDEALLSGRVTAPLGYDAVGYADSNVFRYRSCDVNNDRNINRIDANRLRSNPADLITAYEPIAYRPAP